MKTNIRGQDTAIHKRNCDVLVIGGGPAGMKAASEASKIGAKTIIVAKEKVGKSGNAVIARGGHSAPFGHIDPVDNILYFQQDILKSGRYINDKRLVKTLVNNSCEKVEELRLIGVEFETSDNKYVQKPAAGHTFPRGCYPKSRKGMDITLSMLKDLKDQKVEVLDQLFVVKLIIVDQKCLGGLFQCKETGEIYVINAKSTILSTGGAGSVFKNTTNYRGATGDGYALALDAGLYLRDMEFVQFYPAVMISPLKKFLVSPALFAADVRLLNREGERFLKDYNSNKMEFSTRDVKSRAIYSEIIKGKDVKGGVIMDISNLNQEDLQNKASDMIRIFKARKLDPFKRELIITPAAHFFMGGIEIKDNCKTGIEGLFACGEVTGGIHGANRLANNALTECQVFGFIAGESAAKFAAESKLKESPNKLVKSLIKEAKSLYTSIPPAKMISEIKDVMWEKVGVIRRGPNLKDGIRKLSYLRKEFKHSGKANKRIDLIPVFEAKNSLETALAISISALKRCESRGAHFRTDYPEENKRWLKAVSVDKEDIDDNVIFRN